MRCLFASDLHGDRGRYETLLDAAAREQPDAMFLGGDLLPPGAYCRPQTPAEFVRDDLGRALAALRTAMAARYPRVFLIMGNDDERAAEGEIEGLERAGLLAYVHERRALLGPFEVYGYACVPPTPFQLKDWERYDVSRHVEPGSIPPEDGRCSVPLSARVRKYATIKADLARLGAASSLERAVFLFHAPPYATRLDRAALDAIRFEGVPLDVHVGSIAVRRFIEERQPLLTLHGHVHESAGLSGSWRDRIGRTHLFSAAHVGPELALVRFDPERLEDASRELL